MLQDAGAVRPFDPCESCIDGADKCSDLPRFCYCVRLAFLIDVAVLLPDCLLTYVSLAARSIAAFEQ